MKKFVIMISCLITACCSFPAGISRTPNLPTKSYVKVEKHLLGMKRGSGSGTVIDVKPEGAFILTAAHVCLLSNQLEKIKILDMGGGDHEGVVVRVDEAHDMCMIFAKGLDAPEVTISMIAPKAGDVVYSISSPYGMEDIHTGTVPIIQGTYSGMYDAGFGLFWDMYNLRIAPGSSGGMIVDRYGHMIGMTHRLFVMGSGKVMYTDMSVGAQYEDLREFLGPYI